MNIQRIGGVLIKEVQQLGRDRMTFAMIAVMPLIQLLLFGFAINTDVRNLTTGIADQAQSHLSRPANCRASTNPGRTSGINRAYRRRTRTGDAAR